MKYDAAALSEAIRYASNLHKYGRDKNGEPAILHSLRVMFSVDGYFAQILAVLHDVVEDCGVSLKDIEYAFDKTIAESLDYLTHVRGTKYRDYIKRLNDLRESNEYWPEIILVKIKDIEDNLSRGELLANWDDYTRLTEKYHKALVFLKTGKDIF